MNRFGRLATTALALLLLAPAPATAAGGTLEPEALPRGADLFRPYVEGTSIVDLARQRVVDVPDARRLEILGVTRYGWFVSKRRLVIDHAFIRHDGTEGRLPGGDEGLVIDPGGRLYTEAGLVSDGETAVGVRRVRDGKRLATHVFRSWVDDNIGRFARPIDLVGHRMLIGGDGGRVVVWNWRRDTVRTVRWDKWHLRAGSLRNDIAAGFTAPGERCTVVARLSRPGRELWRSCSEQVLSFSPDGRLMVTVDRRVLPGFGRIREVTMRTVTGKRLGRWRAENFTDIAWDGRRISFRVRGTAQTAMVRCSASQCSAASDPVPVTG